MKIKVKSRDCYLIVRVKVSFGEKIDAQQLDYLERTYLRGFLKPKLIKKNLIEYTGPVGVSLQERLKKTITKRDFFFIMEQIVVAVQKVYANGLSLDKLLLDMQNVFINEVTKEVQFVYLPIEAYSVGTNIVEFVQKIICSSQPAQEQDMESISRFSYFLNEVKVFNTERIEQYIASEDTSVVSIIKRQNAGQSGFMTDKPQHYFEHYARNTDVGNVEATTILAVEGVEEATTLLGEENDVTDLLTDDTEGTAILDENFANVGLVHFPILIRVLTGEEIRLDKPVFRMGKERNYVDYFIGDNSVVSRRHADIITRGKKYFVMDLNSKNHTYINEEILPVQCEVEIHDGDKLKFANEEFIFQV